MKKKTEGSVNRYFVRALVICSVIFAMFGVVSYLNSHIKEKAIDSYSDKKTWTQYEEDRLGFNFAVPSKLNVIMSKDMPDTLSMGRKSVVITNMKLNESTVPTKENVIYMPTDGGIGGPANGEIPIYKGIEIRITLDSLEGDSFDTINEIKSKKNYESVYKVNNATVYSFSYAFVKNNNSSKLCQASIIKDKRVYTLSAIYLNRKEYDQLVKDILESITFTENIAKDLKY